MSFKEWNAAVMLASAVAIGAWLMWDAASRQAWNEPAAEAARTMLWALLASIVINVVGMILVAIAVSVARREAMEDERADERDRSVGARSMRNAYGVLSAAGALVLVVSALGGSPAAALYLLMAGLLLAGATDAASRLVYYRIG